MNPNSGQQTRAAIDAVVADVDLVGVILAGNIGPSGFAAASLVCKVWLSVCRMDERVLRGVAAYQGGLTKGVFMKLFAISSQEADALPRTKHKRYGGGVYFLYHREAVDAILAAGGITNWRTGLRLRIENTSITRWPSRPGCVRRASQQEERLHARALHQRGCYSCQVGG